MGNWTNNMEKLSSSQWYSRKKTQHEIVKSHKSKSYYFLSNISLIYFSIRYSVWNVNVGRKFNLFRIKFNMYVFDWQTTDSEFLLRIDLESI